MSTARRAYADSATRTYRVVVSHDGDLWVADVPELEGAITQAGNLTRLDEAIREVIALAEDLPEGAESSLDLVYEYEDLDALGEAAATLGRLRAELDRVQAAVAEQTSTLVHALALRQWSVRDIAPLLAMSPGRVSQIRQVRPVHDVNVLLQMDTAEAVLTQVCKYAPADMHTGIVLYFGHGDHLNLAHPGIEVVVPGAAPGEALLYPPADMRPVVTTEPTASIKGTSTTSKDIPRATTPGRFVTKARTAYRGKPLPPTAKG